MYFSPFDLFDSLSQHGNDNYAGESDEAHIANINQSGADDLSFDGHHGIELVGAHAGSFGADHSFAEHDGHGLRGGYEEDTALHVVDGNGHAALHAPAPVLNGHPLSDGSPENVDHFDHRVDFDMGSGVLDHSHALVEQTRTLESILDRHLSEAEVAQLNQAAGWHDSQRGTTLNDFSRLIEDGGMAVERSFDTPLSDLHDALAGGDKVLVGLIGPPHASFPGDGQEPGGEHVETGHTALVTDIQQDDHGRWFVTVSEGGATDDHGQQIPLERFVESWDRCGRFALFAGPQVGAEGTEQLGHLHNPLGSMDHALDHHLGDLGQLEPGKIIGTPYHDVEAWPGQQHALDTCAIRSQEFVIEQFTGHDIPEETLVQEAQSHGWYQPGYGTPPEHTGDLLELHGIPVTRHEHASIEELADELGQGHKVIIGVNAEELWHNDDPVLHGIKEVAGLNHADHAVVVSGVDTRDPANIQVLISDPGSGQELTRYPLEQFLTAWKDSDFFIVATKAPVPSTAPEMAHFDYDKGHIDAVAGIPWYEFVKRLAVPGALAVLLRTSRKQQDSPEKKTP